MSSSSPAGPRRGSPSVLPHSSSGPGRGLRSNCETPWRWLWAASTFPCRDDRLNVILFSIHGAKNALIVHRRDRCRYIYIDGDGRISAARGGELGLGGGGGVPPLVFSGLT